MKNPTTAILTAASELLTAGTKMKEVLAIGWSPKGDGSQDPEGERLNYSQTWLFHERAKMDASEFITLPAGSPERAKAVADARNAGQSWGYIAVRCNAPESQVRREFEEATGNKSIGLRIGRGGRWVYDEPQYYENEARIVGITIPKDQKGRPALPGRGDHLSAKSYGDLKGMLKAIGKPTNGKKADLVERLLGVEAGTSAK